MNTDRFDRLRKEVLAAIFTKKNIVDTWRNVVRDQLRAMDYKDLYDYYDLNYNIEDRAHSLRTEITSGAYRASTPLVYRVEKKFGVCRHMVIPNPVDALTMQVLVDCVADGILSQQPSQNAFYTRSKHNIPIPHQAAEYGLNIRSQWIKLQKEIYRFSEEKELLVVTDLANYYDSISIEELRKAFLGLVRRLNSEVIVDILFRIIEDISWKPDYLPYRRHGLPTSNLEAIRLLAHAFVFEVDSVLDAASGGCFTRWMDDIVFGADSKRAAIGTISSISDILKSRGLALNLAKTAIYTTKEAFYHFQIEENKYLDGYGEGSVDDDEHDEKTGNLLTRFIEHLDHRDARYWGKVTKRYITAFGRSKSDKILLYVVGLYIDNPSLRPNLLIYLASLGYTENTGTVILEVLSGIDLFDDISLFQIAHLIAQWEVPVSPDANRFLDNVRNQILSFSFSTKNPADFYSVLWFRAKYDHGEDLLQFVRQYQNLWQSNPFLRRQVTSVFSRLLVNRSIDIDEIISMQIASGIASVVSVATQLRDFASISSIDKRLSLYLFNIKKPQRPYPLAKFLVLCSVLNSEPVRRSAEVRTSVLEHIFDPYYLKWLDHQYNIR